MIRSLAVGVAAVMLIAGGGIALAGSGPVWTDCPPLPKRPGRDMGPIQCTKITVPMDYATGAGKVQIAVSRIKARAAKRGTLIYVPGGPGDRGLQSPQNGLAQLPQSITDRYDLVGFDPRGLGESTRGSCELPADRLLEMLRPPFPGPDGDIERNITNARDGARQCAEHGGRLVRSLSTLTEVRDLDRVRSALGVPAWTMWGHSYGSSVGAMYATVYPDRAERVLLESSGDPDPVASFRGSVRVIGPVFDERFPDFARWASDPGNVEHRLADTPEQVRELVLKLSAELDRQPQVNIDGAGFRFLMFRGLYNDQGFPDFAKLVKQVQRDEVPVTPAPDPEKIRSKQSEYAVLTGTVCNESRWPDDLDGYRREVQDSRQRYPLTAGMPANVWACAFWQPRYRAVPISDRGPANVLLLQHTRDVVAPEIFGTKTRQAFGERARLITVEGGGHDVYGTSACGDALVEAFLAGGPRPATDLRCAEGARAGTGRAESRSTARPGTSPG
ncbi:alpha/beta fold hydrolase [Pseudonocardiaceae bacterium YIM PH 21723]|nr:alpha/beta fold hydrolase [Pseudonocardiaceae bacterium YIM PH 21723]